MDDWLFQDKIKNSKGYIEKQKKDIKWLWVVTVLHCTIAIWELVSFFVALLKSNSEFSWLSLGLFLLWSVCVYFDYLSIKKANKRLYKYKKEHMDIIKKYDPKEWKRIMREKKLKTILQ